MKQTGGKQQPNQIVLWSVLGVFLAGCVIYLYFQFASPNAPPAPVPVVVTAPVKVAPAAKTGAAVAVAVAPGSSAGAAAKNLGTTSAQLDPTLRMEAMLVTESLVYSGSGRNIFSATSVPVDIPKPIASVRPKPGPPPPPPPPPGPPPPPPIDLKFFGTATAADGRREAFLLHGDDVFLAADGDIVQRKYKVISISANSILVEDMANNNRQTLPLLAR
jgi:hypothetical protein